MNYTELRMLLGRKFVCKTCKRRGGTVRHSEPYAARTSILFGPPELTNVSCNYCGYTEAYDTKTLLSKSNLDAFLDELFPPA